MATLPKLESSDPLYKYAAEFEERMRQIIGKNTKPRIPESWDDEQRKAWRVYSARVQSMQPSRKEHKRKYKQENPEVVKKYSKKYYHTHKQQEKNKTAFIDGDPQHNDAVLNTVYASYKSGYQRTHDNDSFPTRELWSEFAVMDCEICGRHTQTTPHTIRRIDNSNIDMDQDNLITVCHKCVVLSRSITTVESFISRAIMISNKNDDNGGEGCKYCGGDHCVDCVAIKGSLTDAEFIAVMSVIAANHLDTTPPSEKLVTIANSVTANQLDGRYSN